MPTDVTLAIEAAKFLGTALAAIIGIKASLNGMQRRIENLDERTVPEIRREVKEGFADVNKQLESARIKLAEHDFVLGDTRKDVDNLIGNQ